ncbi:MAG: ATP-binding protein [bacterium]|nr:ATP-binding protein [bacterium]
METQCEKCGGSGWLLIKKDKAEIARKCDCQKMNALYSKYDRTNIPKRFLTANMDGYFPDKNFPSQKKAKNAIQKFIDNYPGVLKGLMLQGPVGVGKTRLLCTVATELIKKNKDLDIYYIDWNDLIREMRSGEDHASRDFATINQLIARMVSVDLLIFDEIGASRMSPWVLDNIYYLFNKRYNNQKITLCATNYFDKVGESRELLVQRIGDRIRSRLYEMTDTIEIKGEDLREPG